MKPNFEPEPTPDEREALEVALARLFASPQDPRSAWWRQGLEQALEEKEDAYNESS